MFDQSTAAATVSDKLSCSNEESTQENLVQESQSVEVQDFQDVPIINGGEFSGARDTERLVNLVDSGPGTDFSLNIEDRDRKEHNTYDHYLTQIEKGEDLQGLVRHLVTVLAQKDKEISSLKMQLSSDER